MKQAVNRSRVRPVWRSAMLACAGVLGTAVVLVGQQNSTVPQPRADRLPPPGPASPKPSRGVPRADGMMPTVPAGFTVTSYAELQAPRMMVYAPNGDLFVSSPAANNITVLRDANNDGVFESRGVFAQGDPPAGRRGGGPPPSAPSRTAGAARRRSESRAGGCRSAGGRSAGCAASRGAAGRTRRRRTAASTSGRPRSLDSRRQRAGVRGAAGVREARCPVRSRRRSASPSTMAISTSATRPRSSATSTPSGDLQAQGAPEKLMDLPPGGHYHAQHPVQPRRHEDVHRRRLALEQRRRRRLPPRRHSRVQSRTAAVSACTRRAFATRSAWRCSRAPTSSGRR